MTLTPYSDSLSLGLQILLFNPATPYKSPAHSSTGTRSDSKSSHCLSADGFMFYFTPLRGFCFNFPSRYYFAIGHSGVFSLTRWSSQIHTGFHVPHATRDLTVKRIFDYWTFTIYGAGFSCFVSFRIWKSNFQVIVSSSHDPNFNNWFRLVPVRSPLLWESLLLSFPPATKMFQFTGLSLS